MNLKKTIALSALAVASGVSAHAAVLVAGWDFGNFSYPANTVDSNWSDITGDANTSSPANGTLYMDGTNGSTAMVNEFFGTALTTNFEDVNKNLSLSASDDRGPLASMNSNNTSVQLTSLANGSSIVFAVNALSSGAYDLTSLTYAASITNGGSVTAVIGWEYTFNTSGSWIDLGSQQVTASQSAGGVAQSLDLSSMANGNGPVYIRATVSGLTASTALNLDNVQIYGDVVPEPSTYAGIAGGLALAFVALRRRLRK